MTEDVPRQIYYRVRDYRTAGAADECGDPIPGSGSPGFTLEEYDVLKRTPKGVWLRRAWRGLDLGDDKRFMRDDAHKRFAAPSIDEAVEHWRARKAAQKRIYAARLRQVDEALGAVHGEIRRWKKARGYNET